MGLAQPIEKLDPVFRDFLGRIAKLQNERGRFLTAPEIVVVEKAAGTSDRTTLHRLKRLAEFECLLLEGGERSRVVQLTTRGWDEIAAKAPRLTMLKPGAWNEAKHRIGCSPLKEATCEAEYVDHPFREWIHGRDYLFEAEGDSMFNSATGKGIRPGDQLRMRNDVAPDNGEIVHAVDMEAACDDCTLKVYSFNATTGMVTLWALNPAYEDIVLPEARVMVKGVMQEQVTPAQRWSRK